MKRSKKKSNRELIDNILDKFDFNGVKKIMETLNWRWAMTDDVPSVFEMRKTAKRLLEELCENQDIDFIATGGFEARKMDNGLELRFIAHETWGPINGDGVIRDIIIK